MGSIVETVINDFIGKFILLFVIAPVGIILLGYIIYIVVNVIKETRKK